MRESLKIFATTLGTVLVSAILLALPVSAAESVYITLQFNVATNEEFTVTVYGGTACTSVSGGTECTDDIEFNSTDGDDEWVNATRVGGSTQDVSNPIIQIQNTGNANLEINISTNTDVGSIESCMDLRFNGTYCDSPSTCSGDLNATPWTLNSTIEPTGTQNLWLWGNFSGCTDTDDITSGLDLYINSTTT